MTPQQTAHLTIREAAGLLGAPSATTDEVTGACRLVLDTETVIDIEFNTAAGTVVFHADVASVPRDARLQVYELLLQYNYLWHQSGGIRMALASLPGPVAMLLDLPLADLDVSRVCGALTSMAHTRRTWREVLLATGAAAGRRDSTPALARP
jgi:hypothetical protein